MASSEVIYLPSQRRETLGSDIGGMIGAMIGSEMNRQSQQQQMEKAKLMVDGIRKAPDRAAALEVVSNYAPLFRTPQDYATAFGLVDRFKPLSEETPTPLTAYSLTTGEPTTVFPTRKQMNDPNYFKGQNVGLTKQDMSDFYMPGAPAPGAKPDAEPVYTHIGKLPVNQRPEGALTPQEITMARAGRTEKRQERAGERRDEAADRAERNSLRVQERMNATVARLGEALAERDVQHGQTTLRNAQKLLATSMNIKTFPDGSFDLAGVDENRQKLFMDRINAMATIVEANPKVLKTPTAEARLVSAAHKSVPSKADKEADKPKAPPPKKDKGWGPSALWDKITGAAEESKPTMSAADRKTYLANAKIGAANIRNGTLPMAEKKKSLDTIRKRLREAGINEDI